MRKRVFPRYPILRLATLALVIPLAVAIAFSPDVRSAQTPAPDSLTAIPCPATISSIHPYVRQLEGHSDQVLSLTFHPDGSYLAGGSTDGSISIWDPQTTDASPVRTLNAAADPIVFVAFTPDGSRMLSCSSEGLIKLWNTFCFDELAELEPSATRPSAVSLCPDGSQFALVSTTGAVVVWDLAPGAPLTPAYRIDLAPDTLVQVVRFDPQLPNALWLGCADGAIELWSLDSGRRLDRLEGHTKAVTALAFHVGEDGSIADRWMLFGSSDGDAVLWTPAGLERLLCRWQFAIPVSVVALTPVTHWPVVGLVDGTLTLLSATPCRLISGVARIGSAITSIAAHPCGRAIAAATVDGIVTLIDLHPFVD
jgi:WD40 repeat protein